MTRLILDVDGVVCNFVQGAIERSNELEMSRGFCCWKDVDTYHFFTDEVWRTIKGDTTFWLNLRPMPSVRRKMVTNGVFPDMYLTARPVESWVTGQWIQSNWFPTAGVVTVANPLDKIQHLREGDVFVDDHPATVRAALEIGVTAFLMDAPFHRGVDPHELEGLPKIRCITELVPFIPNN